ncbi:hypothetical protein NJ7G_1131 [Natrinema sp. J7-2]|nr:hypothetical protein NJ7G_1131 [Natrinema sp. J7-2]
MVVVWRITERIDTEQLPHRSGFINNSYYVSTESARVCSSMSDQL